ncbi:MAG: hypothetical protein HY013_03405 [Candidatus Solibacter usitatus]|nr:hypothetical protein [Candidatus Solibacter usitatus]
MGLIVVSGQAGCRFEEVGRITAARLGFELLTESQIAAAMDTEVGPGNPVPAKAYADVAGIILARLATQHHCVIAADGLETLHGSLPGMLRAYIVAPEAARIGNLMVDRRVDRPIARQLLRELQQQRNEIRRKRFGRATASADSFDLTLNAEQLASEQMAALVEEAARSTGLLERGFLSAAAEAQLQFQMRLRLARHGLSPTGAAALPRKAFAHPSEEIFAHLLDFYRIPWEYEPRSFPVQWDREGKVLEAFTPDFYLPEMDLYVELTTMKQSLVTRKNRKVKLLRELYPQINIQVFYQKDFENLIFKYGLAGRLAPA